MLCSWELEEGRAREEEGVEGVGVSVLTEARPGGREDVEIGDALAARGDNRPGSLGSGRGKTVEGVLMDGERL